MIVFAFPHDGTVRAKFMASHYSLRYNGAMIEAEGCYVAKNRNTLVRKFLSMPEDYDWLLMVDTDMEFEPDLAEKLLKAADPEKRPIVVGLCFIWAPPEERHERFKIPVWYRKAKTYGYVALKEEEIRPDALYELDAAGTGCMMIHRSVLKRVGEAYADDPWSWFGHDPGEGDRWGDDKTFCRRAKALGFRIFGVGGARLWHHKAMPI